jgi:hypothetical protein
MLTRNKPRALPGKPQLFSKRQRVYRQHECPIYFLSRLLRPLPGPGGGRRECRSALNYAIELTIATSIT